MRKTEEDWQPVELHFSLFFGCPGLWSFVGMINSTNPSLYSAPTLFLGFLFPRMVFVVCGGVLTLWKLEFEAGCSISADVLFSNHSGNLFRDVQGKAELGLQSYLRAAEMARYWQRGTRQGLFTGWSVDTVQLSRVIVRSHDPPFADHLFVGYTLIWKLTEMSSLFHQIEFSWRHSVTQRWRESNLWTLLLCGIPSWACSGNTAF